MPSVDIYNSINVIVERPIHFLFLLVNKKMNSYEAVLSCTFFCDGVAANNKVHLISHITLMSTHLISLLLSVCRTIISSAGCTSERGRFVFVVLPFLCRVELM